MPVEVRPPREGDAAAVALELLHLDRVMKTLVLQRVLQMPGAVSAGFTKVTPAVGSGSRVY